MCHCATLYASSVPKAVACCSILGDSRKENILMLLKRNVQLFFCHGIVFISVEITGRLSPSNSWWLNLFLVYCPNTRYVGTFVPPEEWGTKLSFVFSGPLVEMSRPGEGITLGQFSKRLGLVDQKLRAWVSFLIDVVQRCLHSLCIKYATRAPHHCGCRLEDKRSFLN